MIHGTSTACCERERVNNNNNMLLFHGLGILVCQALDLFDVSRMDKCSSIRVYFLFFSHPRSLTYILGVHYCLL